MLDDPPRRRGRLLPAGDPFLAQRDRATLLPDKTAQRAVWRPVGAQGWSWSPVIRWERGAAGGSRLEVTIEPFTKLSDRQRTAIEAEAEIVAPFRGREEATVTFAD